MTQAQALQVMLSGASVFLTGPPGSGKTYVLNEFVRLSQSGGRRVAVTASTGIAATHIGGVTLHSWSGLGVREKLGAADRKWLGRNNALRKRYQATDILVIDEVSMLHGHRLDMLSEAGKILRGCEQPFGGLQVVLVGDLFQLPPVHRGHEPVDFIHTSAAWRSLDLRICYLNEQHRQSGDCGLLEVLEAVRECRVSSAHVRALHDRVGLRPAEHTPVTRLCTHNANADAINERCLASLQGAATSYIMMTNGQTTNAVKQLADNVLAPQTCTLRVGAEVMFVANNPVEGYINGSRGQVTSFKRGLPRVRLQSTGKTVTVGPYSWTLTEGGRVHAEVVQLPLRLAWAMTIHKSQGMSLDAAEIDLSHAFLPGMGYVALSRVCSLDGVYLRGLNRVALQVDQTILAFDQQLRLGFAPSSGYRGPAASFIRQ